MVVSQTVTSPAQEASLSNRIRKSLAAVVIGGSIMIASGVPVQAAAADNCHPPRYDTVHCVCVAVGRVWIALTGEDWACA